VLREAIGNRATGITMRMLRGHEGSMALAARLRDALGGLLQHVDEDAALANASKYLIFAARNKATRCASQSAQTCTKLNELSHEP
jgi:hypothetical protein